MIKPQLLKNIYLFFSLLFISFFSKAQVDTQFWFAVPYVGNHGNGNSEIIINNTQNTPVTVTLTNPANPAGGIPAPGIVRNIPANGSMRIDLNQYYRTQDQGNAGSPIGSLQTIEGRPNQVFNSGLLLTSTSPVTAYYEVGRGGGQNCDIFSLKGNNALGTDFMLPFQNHYSNWANINAYSAADIVATEDNTQITITPTAAAAVGRPAGVPFTITLNRGQTYCLRAEGKAANQQMSGTTVTSNKPIAITLIVDSIDTGADTSWGPDNTGIDMAGDQIVPLNYIGKEYIVVRGNAGNNGNRNRIFILTTQPNTNITISENTNVVRTINNQASGVTINYLQPNNSPASYIKSDKPVYVFYISGNGSELGGALIPSIVCTGSSSVVISRSSENPFYFVVLAKNKFLDNFLVGGQAGILTRASFTIVTDATDEGFSSAKISYGNGTTGALSSTNFPLNQAVLITNTATNAAFHIGTANGGGNGEGSTARFGYFSDFASINISYENKPVCFGDSLILDAGPGRDTYKWFTKPTPTTEKLLSSEQVFKVKAPGRQKIYLTITKRNCPLTDSVEVYVQPKVNLTVLRKRIVCANQPISMDATPEVTVPPLNIVKYRWYRRPNATIPLTGDTIGFTTSIAPQLPVGDFEVIVFVTDDQACTSSDTVKVKINPTPAVGIDFANASVCSGDSVQLGLVSPNINYVYQWKENGVLPLSQVIATGLSSTIISNPKASRINSTSSAINHNYYISTLDTITSCIKLDTLVLTVNPIPKAQIDLPRSLFCISDPLFALQGSAPSFTGGTYVFSINNNNVTQFDPKIYPLGNTTIKLAYTSAQGCKAPDVDSLVRISSVPSVVMTDQTYCSGKSATIGILDSSAFYNYLWNTTPDITNLTISNASINVRNNGSNPITNNYTLTVTSKTNTTCTNSGNVSVIINPQPVASFTNVNPLGYCVGAANVTFTGTPTGGAFSGDNITGSVFSPNTVGTKKITYQVTLNGCSDDTIVNISVHALPKLLINGFDKSSYCVGAPSVLINGTPSGGGFSASKSPGLGGDVDFTTAGNLTFTYGLTDNNGCTDSVSTSITVNPIPILTTSPVAPICAGDIATLSVSGGNTYEWTTLRSTNATVDVRPIVNSSYEVRAINTFNCKSLPSNIDVMVNPKPTAKFEQKNITHCFELGDLSLFAGFASNYLWSNGSTTDTLTVSSGGEYKVTLVEGNCKSSDSVIILAACPPRIFLPKAFSPNNDGYNDSLQVLGDHFKNLKLRIYNRWGEVVFESTDKNKFWDGTYNGVIMPQGVYPWQLSYQSDFPKEKNKEYTLDGSISIIY
ncbi:MAG: gliding motility-associated C-terminal domain-containing protein [Cytophagales bacterium]|nr:MAG: gliding motility-associated C-terminal domain-containing protein [Cytophagales bacterium]